MDVRRDRDDRDSTPEWLLEQPAQDRARARGLLGRRACVVALECELGRLAPLDPAVAVATPDCGTDRGLAGEGSAARGGVRRAWKRRREAAVGRAPPVRGDVVTAPRRVAVDVDTAGRAMTGPRRTRQEQKD